jgi:hypothetical protein
MTAVQRDRLAAASFRQVSAVIVPLAQQLRQLGDVDSDPAGFVLGQHLGLHCLGFTVPGIDVDEGLAVGVTDDIAAGYLVGAPGRRKAAGDDLQSEAIATIKTMAEQTATTDDARASW